MQQGMVGKEVAECVRWNFKNIEKEREGIPRATDRKMKVLIMAHVSMKCFQ